MLIQITLTYFSGSTASSDNLDDTGSLSAEEEDVSSSNTEKAIDEELPVMEERQQSSSVEEAEVQEESSPVTQEIRTVGSGYAAASSSAEFSLQPSVRHTMLLKRKEAMLQQARRYVNCGFSLLLVLTLAPRGFSFG